MKKVLIVLAIVILIVIIGIIVIKWIGQDKDGNGEIGVVEPQPEIPLSEKINVSVVTRNNDSTRCTVRTERPYIENLPDYSKQDVINNKISNSINPYITEINVVSEGSTTVVSNDNLVDTKLYSYYVTFDRYNNDKYLTLVVNQDIRISLAGNEVGGLRSNKWKDTYVIDCETSKEVSLGDICNFANYKSYIVDEINRQARINNIPLVGNSQLIDIPDSQRFFIKDNKLFIYFEPASIAPYLAGELIFEMPFTYSNGQFVR